LTIEGWKVYDQIAPEAIAFEARLKDSLDEREAALLDTLLSKLTDKATEL
jgi:DNA-binding MarR family transcriptional regulator